jgi:hypothetical protein
MRLNVKKYIDIKLLTKGIGSKLQVCVCVRGLNTISIFINPVTIKAKKQTATSFKNRKIHAPVA